VHAIIKYDLQKKVRLSYLFFVVRLELYTCGLAPEHFLSLFPAFCSDSVVVQTPCAEFGEWGMGFDFAE